MSRTKYADAVAAVKAMENTLLSKSDIEQLISAGSKYELDSIISQKKGAGCSSPEEVWEFIRSYAPDCRELEILLYKNDFHNLKAALKAIISGREPEKYYIRPTNLELESFGKILISKEYENLPEYIRETAEKAYMLLTETLDGQLADSFIDTCALRTVQKATESFGGKFIRRYAQLTVACADIKTAYRCSKMKKSGKFLESAVCGSCELEKEQLVKAALGGTDELIEFLEGTSYSEAAKLLEESTAQFEKWCDDMIMNLAEEAGMQSFGSEPLMAYYIASEAEFKNLRIITVCRECGTDRETITERMRKLYV